MSYQPNPKNKAFIRRANLAIAFVDKYVKSTPNWLSQKWIEDPKHFGSHRNDLSQWLREQLLTCVDPHFNYLTGKCKKYVKNAQGYELVMNLLSGQNQPTLTASEQQQLDTGNFDYTDKSQRSYTWLQFYPCHRRNSILNNNGYKYHYDIESAAPTLLLQSARRQNPQLLTPNLDFYMNNRQEMREKIAVACQLSELQVKAVINSILQGGVISSYDTNKTFNDILNRNYSAVYLLNTNTDIINLKEEIKQLWASLRGLFPVRYNLNGRKMRLSSKLKASYYRELENQVGGCVRKYLKKHSVRWLWIHDGWACDEGIDPSAIVSEVKKQTGYAIKLDWTIYED